jgi:hypothetical protein
VERRWEDVNDEIREKRREQLLKARARRAELIEKQMLNPRARKPVTQAIANDTLAGYRRAAAAFYRRALRERG